MTQAVQVFSTQSVPGPRKVEMWNSILGELADAVHVQPRDPLHFDGTLIRQRVGPMTLFEVRCASVRVSHHRRLAARSARPSFQVLMPVQSEFSLVHGDRPSIIVGTGSLCLIDRSSPYELLHGDGMRTIGLELPRALLESCMPQLMQYAGAVVRPDSPASRVLGGLLRSLGFELNSEDSPGVLPPMIATSVAGFVAAAFARAEKAAPSRGITGRLAAFREYADARLGDGEFRPAMLARHFKVSERYVRVVFSSSGESLSAFLLRRRLERAARLLCSEYYAQHTITQIALECGFNSASHFGQSFRHRYGQAPREFRTAARAGRSASTS
jgi:AraC-like DNA-binding protein